MTDSQRVGTDDSATATAHCPPGTRVLLGGARVRFSRHGAPRTVISRESLVSQRAWRIRGYTFGKRSANGEHGHLTAIAYCKRSARIRTVVTDVYVPPNGRAKGKATCPPGTIIRFGGYRAALRRAHFNPALVVSALKSPSRRTWLARASNLGPTKAGRMRIFAYCGKT